jgi:hypothetical protein
MKLRSRTLPSPAMVVAVAAIALGLVGSAVAGSGVLSKAQVKKVATKQADKRITKRAPGLSVAKARTAQSAQTAQTAQSAESATTAGTAGSARNVLAAEVANGCAQISGGIGTINVAAEGNECAVLFPRSIRDCAITLGTRLDVPGGGETTYRKATDQVVQVSRRDSAGGSATAGAFSIAAICPA